MEEKYKSTIMKGVQPAYIRMNAPFPDESKHITNY